MPWTKEQSEAIFEGYWQRGTASCPTCAAIVRFNFNPFTNGQYTLHAQCPRQCGRFQAERGDDPRSGSFRPWTDKEGPAVINDHFRNDPTICPVDGSQLTVQESHFHGGVLVTALCRRCGQGWREQISTS